MSDRVSDEDGSCRLGPLLEMLLHSAAKICPEIEDSSDHAVIDSRWITDCTA